MAEKASIFQATQIGIEATAGTLTAANRKLLSVSIDVQPKTTADPFRALGNKYASFLALNKEWTEFGLSGKLTFNEILYLLSSWVAQPTPTQQGATPAYLWSFRPATSQADDGKTFTIEQGDATSAWRAVGARVTGMSFTFNRNEVSFSGSAIAGPVTNGITLTAAPTSISPIPVLPVQGSFYMADTQAGLTGATALTRAFSLTWGVTDKSGLFWPIGQNPGTVEREPRTDSRLRLAMDADGVGLYTTMRNGATKWFRIKYTGALIQSTYYQTFQLDFPAQISDPSLSDEDGIFVTEMGLTPIHDATWGRAYQIDITTNVQTL